MSYREIREASCKNCIWHYPCSEVGQVVCTLRNQLVSKNDCCIRFAPEDKQPEPKEVSHEEDL